LLDLLFPLNIIGLMREIDYLPPPRVRKRDWIPTAIAIPLMVAILYASSQIADGNNKNSEPKPTPEPSNGGDSRTYDKQVPLNKIVWIRM
jgi:hypothetical protein